MMRKSWPKGLFTLFALLPFLYTECAAQVNSLTYEAEMQAIATSNNVVPFWMRSNQYGSIPFSGISTSFLGRIKKDYAINFPSPFEGSKLMDWGAGVEGRVNTNGKKNEFILSEAYLKGRLGPFELKAGRLMETTGLTGDTVLTSGSFSISGNALGIPKIDISIPEFYTLPLLNGIIAVKGNFAHGYVGKARILDTIRNRESGNINVVMHNTSPITYVHQKSLYGRLGKPDWKIKFYAGFNHQVFWGNERQAYGSSFELSPAKTFQYVVTGKAYGNKLIPRSKIGNHIGSIDLGMIYDFQHLQMSAYRQNFYDVGALYYLANLRDGLNGISITNLNPDRSDFKWKKFLIEFFYSKNQAGELWSKSTPSGDEDYYNNYYYKAGWSYKELGLGTPLITPKAFARIVLASHPADFFINNRVMAFHFGSEVSFQKWLYISKLTYSNNYGTFGTSSTGKSTGSKRDSQNKIFDTLNQLSVIVKSVRRFDNDFNFGYILTVDRGELFNNSNGVLVTLGKSF